MLATPTGSGKSLVAIAAHFAALAEGRAPTTPRRSRRSCRRSSSRCATIFGAENVGMLTGDAAVNAGAPIICCTAEVLANIALREGADADVGQVVMDEFHFYADAAARWAWQVPLLSPAARPVPADVGDARRRHGARATTSRAAPAARRRWSTPPSGPCRSTSPGRSSRCTSCSRSSCAADQAPIYVVHFTQASAIERAQSLLSAKLCTREERDAIADAIGGFRFTAGFGRTLPARAHRHRRPPRRHAAALPAARRAARAARPAEGHLRHRHARRRHQRPDPHRALHRPGEVRRHEPPAAEGARVPPDRRPRRARRLRHSRLRGRAGARARHRERAARWPRPATTPRSAARCRSEAAGRRGLWTEETFERLARGARAAGLAHARQPLDAPQRHRPARRTPSRPARAHDDNHETSAGRRGCASTPRRCATSCSTPASWSGRRARRATAARCGSRPTCRRTSRSTSRCPRSRWPRSTCSTPSPRRYALDVVSSSRRSSTTRARCSWRRRTRRGARPSPR